MLVVLLGSGCVSAPPPDDYDRLQRQNIAAVHIRKDYTVLPGDNYQIQLFRRGLRLERFRQALTVGPDGQVFLQEIERPIDTTGLSMVELRDHIRDAYLTLFQGQAQAAELSVALTFDTSEKMIWFPDSVFIAGEVVRPQTFRYRRGMTVVQAISIAGGIRRAARPERVVLLREEGGQTVTREFDMLAVVRHEADDMEIFPGDIVYVPTSPIGYMDLWVFQYVRRLFLVNPSAILRFVLLTR